MRASSLDRVLSCPASYQSPNGVRIEGDGDAARTGTAMHAIMSPIVRNASELDAHELAEIYHVDPDEVSMLRACGRQLWERIRDGFDDPLCEVEIDESMFPAFGDFGDLGDLYLTGHPDVMSCVDGEVRIADWKTGHTEANCTNQLRAYAYLAGLYYLFRGIPVDRAYVAQLRVRTREIIPATYTWEQLKRWYAGAVNRLQGDETYNPTPENCQYCPRRFECPGRQLMLRNEASVLCDLDQGEEGISLAQMTAEELRHGVSAARVLQKLCERFLDVAKSEVQIRGGELPGLAIVQQERRELMPEAWPLLEKRLGLNVLTSIAKVAKTKVEDEIKRTAAPRRKGADVKEFMAELEAAGVVNVKTIEKLEVRPVPEAIDAAN